MSFTKGPWHIAELTKQYGVYDASGTAVAKVGGAFGVAMERRLADARLIASAPELYEALRLMIADFGDYPAHERPCLAFDLARAALAKAEGK